MGIDLYARYAARPKHRINTEFAHFVNEHHKVMTENLAERFVDHSNVSLAAEAISEFPLHHGERGFNVAALVGICQVQWGN
jgi:hypothetical protein